MAKDKFKIRDSVAASKELRSVDGKKIAAGSKGVVVSVFDWGASAEVMF